jgi:hypothetical protein
MGYYARCNGYFKTVPLSKDEEIELLRAFDIDDSDNVEDITTYLLEAFTDCTMSKQSVGASFNEYTFDLCSGENYHDDLVYDALARVEPFILAGLIEYDGEDGSTWRFQYRNGKWYEDEGYTSYKESKSPLFRD